MEREEGRADEVDCWKIEKGDQIPKNIPVLGLEEKTSLADCELCAHIVSYLSIQDYINHDQITLGSVEMDQIRASLASCLTLFL